MVGLIAGMILAVAYTADVEVKVEDKYPQSYASFKRGFIPSFQTSFTKKAGQSPSEALSEDCCRACFKIIAEHITEGKEMTDDKLGVKLILAALFITPKVNEKIKEECELVVNKHIKAGTVYK